MRRIFSFVLGGIAALFGTKPKTHADAREITSVLKRTQPPRSWNGWRERSGGYAEQIRRATSMEMVERLLNEAYRVCRQAKYRTMNRWGRNAQLRRRELLQEALAS
jgi:hypothetical protein